MLWGGMAGRKQGREGGREKRGTCDGGERKRREQSRRGSTAPTN